MAGSAATLGRRAIYAGIGENERRLAIGVRIILRKCCGGRVMARSKLLLGAQGAECGNGNMYADYIGQTNEWCQKMLGVKATVKACMELVLRCWRKRVAACDDLACNVELGQESVWILPFAGAACLHVWRARDSADGRLPKEELTIEYLRVNRTSICRACTCGAVQLSDNHDVPAKP